MTHPQALREAVIAAIKQAIRDQAPDARDLGNEYEGSFYVPGGCTPQTRGTCLDIGMIADQCLALLPEPEGQGGGVVDGFKLVPVEPQPQQLADAILAGMLLDDEWFSSAENELITATLAVLPPTPHPSARRVIRDLARDYRAMLAASPSPTEGE